MDFSIALDWRIFSN